MTIPAYVPPSQWVADRASFVSDSIRDGGDGIVVARCVEGIALVACQSGADLPQGYEVDLRDSRSACLCRGRDLP